MDHCKYVTKDGREKQAVKVRELGQKKPKIRKYWHLEGLCALKPTFVAHDHSLVNVIRGLVERMYNVKDKNINSPTFNQLVKPPQAVPRARKRLESSKVELLRHVKRRFQGCTRMTALEFIDACPSHLRKRYRNALKFYLERGLRKRDAWIKLFIKFEKHNITKKKDPCPRNIQPRDPVYNLRLGMFLKPLENHVYDAIADMWGGKTVMKGMNAYDTANAIVEAVQDVASKVEDVDKNGTTQGWVAVGADASRFSQHVGKEMLTFEHSIYAGAYQGDPDIKELRWLLKQQLESKGTTYCQDARGVKHKVTYNTNTQRSDGDMNTGLGNCVIMCTLMHTYAKNVAGLKNVRLINNGDDVVIVMSQRDYDTFDTEHFKQWMLEMGFTMEMEEPVYKVEHIEFCQKKIVYTINGAVMCPMPSAMPKYTIALVDQGKTDAWITEVGIAGRIFAKGVPMWGAFFGQYPNTRRMKTSDNQMRNSGAFWLQDGLDESKLDEQITPEARVSFWEASGVTPNEQKWFEQRCRDTTPDFAVGNIRRAKHSIRQYLHHKIEVNEISALRKSQYYTSSWGCGC